MQKLSRTLLRRSTRAVRSHRARAEQSTAPDCLQRPLLRRSRFRQQVSASVRLHSYGKQKLGMRLAEEETTMWHSTVGCIVTLILSLLVVPLTIEAQPPTHVHRIGYLLGT